jgi:hypothetical protein
MSTIKLQDLKVILNQEGSKKYTKVSYPIRYGRYAEMEYGEFRFLFNRNGEVKFIVGQGRDWPHPSEWLKRTIGNNWVYYSTGSYYTGVVDLFGEYYLPCPAYPTNSLFKENPFSRQAVIKALEEFDQIGPRLLSLAEKISAPGDEAMKDFLNRVSRNSTDQLRQKADWLQRILKARISVLPPDCRHVDYDVIPLMVNDGCLYNCSFCEVKSGMDLSCRSRQEITEQLQALKEFFGTDLRNYNSVYLGQHDALGASPDDILFAADQAYTILDIKKSYMQEPRLFLFGSAESFLDKDEDFWHHMNSLPFHTYANIGLESFDDAALRLFKKPVPSAVMQKAFKRMQRINKSYENIEVTANILIGEDLPASHIPALTAHIDEAVKKNAAKGCIYISPLKGSRNTKKLLEQFRLIKQKSRIQTFLYLIQRL